MSALIIVLICVASTVGYCVVGAFMHEAILNYCANWRIDHEGNAHRHFHYSSEAPLGAVISGIFWPVVLPCFVGLKLARRCVGPPRSVRDEADLKRLRNMERELGLL